MLLRKHIQRLSCSINTAAYALILGILILHVLHRSHTANIVAGSSNDNFWFEGPQEGDDQRGHHPHFVIDLRVVAGVFCTVLLAAMSATGSIAACSLLGPLFCLVVGFGLKAATGLAHAAIAGGSLATLCLGLLQTHPWHPSKPLLDLDLALILTPAMLLGISVGVLLNDLLPAWLIAATLVALLLVKAQRAALRGLMTRDEEGQQQAAAKAAAAISSGPRPALRPICTQLSGAAPGSPPQQQPGRAAAAAGVGQQPKDGKASAALPEAPAVQAIPGEAAAGGTEQVPGGWSLKVAAGDAAIATAAAHACCSGSSSGGGDGNSCCSSSCAASSGGGAAAAPGSSSSSSPGAAPPQEAAAAEDRQGQRQLQQQQRVATATAAAADAWDAAVMDGSESCRFSEQQWRQQQQFAETFSWDRQQQQQQQQQQWETSGADCCGAAAAADSSLAAPLLAQSQSSSSSPHAAAGAIAAAGPAPLPRLRLPVGHPVAALPAPASPAPSSPAATAAPWPAAAAAAIPAAAATLWAQLRCACAFLRRAAWFAPKTPLHRVHLAAFPWLKLLSLALLWLGFNGLIALDSLLPLCSWVFVGYMLLFLVLTALVTLVFIRVILVDPLLVPVEGLCVAAAAATGGGRAYSLMEQGVLGKALQSMAAAAAAAEQAGSNGAAQRDRQQLLGPCWRERVREYVCTVAGLPYSQPPQQEQQWEDQCEPLLAAADDVAAGAAAAAEEGACEPHHQQQQRQQSGVKMSLFQREKLRLAQHHPQLLLAGDAGALADGAAAAARRQGMAAATAAGGMRGCALDQASDCSSGTSTSSLVHVAVAAAAVAGAAGVVTGLSGVTVGALLLPVLLEFRVHPQVAAATGVLLVFMSSTAAALAFIMQGRLVGSYAGLFCAVAGAGAAAGGWVMRLLRQQGGVRASGLLLLLAGLQAVAGAGCGVWGVLEVLRARREHEGLGFRALCSYT